MRLAVLKERRAFETRVAATPETVKRLIALGLTIVVEAGAGEQAGVADADFAAAGAEIAPDAQAALSGTAIVFAVQMPEPEQLALVQPNTLLVCIANAQGAGDALGILAERRIDIAAMELLPRITRAQSMDVLSSQANLAGYRAVIEAAAAFERGFPMMMTAAGTVPPARVFIIGAGVAGLQAIATARRMGAIVSATDVRPAAKEEIRSLGAAFVGVEDEETAAQTGAYAREMSELVPAQAGGADDRHRRQERHRDLHRPGDGPCRPGHRDRADGRRDAAGQRDRGPCRRRRRQLRRHQARRAGRDRQSR